MQLYFGPADVNQVDKMHVGRPSASQTGEELLTIAVIKDTPVLNSSTWKPISA